MSYTTTFLQPFNLSTTFPSRRLTSKEPFLHFIQDYISIYGKKSRCQPDELNNRNKWRKFTRSYALTKSLIIVEVVPRRSQQHINTGFKTDQVSRLPQTMFIKLCRTDPTLVRIRLTDRFHKLKVTGFNISEPTNNSPFSINSKSIKEYPT